MAEAIEAARRRVKVPIAATDQDNVALAQRVPGSLTGATLTQPETEQNHLQVIAIDGVKPTLANFESGAYRFGEVFYFIVGNRSAPETQDFIASLRSPQCLEALRAAAVLPDNH